MAKDLSELPTLKSSDKVSDNYITEAEANAIRDETGRLLAKQPKRTIKLPKLANPKAPNYETVQINGYTFVIMRGAEVNVPEEVYNILSRAGLY